MKVVSLRSAMVVLAICSSASVLAAKKPPTSKMTLDSNGGLEVFELDNTDYWFKISGNLHLDTVLYSTNHAQFPNGSTVRRGKVTFRGGVGSDWVYKLDLQHGDKADRSGKVAGGASFGDAFIAYNGWDKKFIAFGQVGVPSGLESWTSSNDLPFMESALPSSLFGSDPGLGVNFTWEGKQFTFSGSVVHPKAGDQQRQPGNLESDPVSFGGRVTYSPIHDDCNVYHSGLTYYHHNLRENNTFNFSTKPELRSRQSPSLTSNIPANTAKDYYVIDLELARRWGPYMVATEYFYTKVNRRPDAMPNNDLSFYGYYVMGSYILTGETKDYSFAGGSFGGVKPRCKTGAWELSARQSYVKLLDNSGVQGNIPVLGFEVGDMVGNAYTTTIGLTWWLNQNVRFMANYSKMNYVDLVVGPNVGVHAFGLRGQVTW